MMKLAQSTKRMMVQAGLLAGLGLTCSLMSLTYATAHPVKYSVAKAIPLQVSTDQVATSPLLTTDDFRAPPRGQFLTGSVDKPRSCGRATFLNCRPRH